MSPRSPAASFNFESPTGRVGELLEKLGSCGRNCVTGELGIAELYAVASRLDLGVLTSGTGLWYGPVVRLTSRVMAMSACNTQLLTAGTKRSRSRAFTEVQILSGSCTLDSFHTSLATLSFVSNDNWLLADSGPLVRLVSHVESASVTALYFFGSAKIQSVTTGSATSQWTRERLLILDRLHE